MMDSFAPEKDALCSETPDKDALIRKHGWVLLSIQQQKKSQFMPSKRSLENELGRNDCCDTPRVPERCPK